MPPRWVGTSVGDGGDGGDGAVAVVVGMGAEAMVMAETPISQYLNMHEIMPFHMEGNRGVNSGRRPGHYYPPPSWSGTAGCVYCDFY